MIGILDDGLAFAHARFREADGAASRVEYFWNQNSSPSDQPAAGYGRDLSQANGGDSPGYGWVVGGFQRTDRAMAPYSAAGRPLPADPGFASIRAPDAAAPSDDSPVCHGVLGAGTRSGAVVRMSGTSVAAPLVTRWLAEQMAGDPSQAPIPPGSDGSGQTAPPPDRPTVPGALVPGALVGAEAAKRDRAHQARASASGVQSSAAQRPVTAQQAPVPYTPDARKGAGRLTLPVPPGLPPSHPHRDGK